MTTETALTRLNVITEALLAQEAELQDLRRTVAESIDRALVLVERARLQLRHLHAELSEQAP
jgi:hypothetical protein